MPEFTGERVEPGQVEADLWNEHLARYAFAARLAHHKRVLDLGCGAGYGSAELARVARSVTAVDVSAAAVASAQQNYCHPRIDWTAARAESLPFASACFDLVVAFEVIEHIDDWASLLSEARRLLAPGGQFIVSTPNRLYYAESRKLHGPNPFHAHEFEFEEFREALAAQFPSVSLYLQNHVQGIAFQPAAGGAGSAQLSIERAAARPEDSHFFLAVCATSSQTGAPTWVYLPSTANLLREREQHIDLLESELRQKNEWLEKSKREHAEMVKLHAEQTEQLQARTNWARKMEADLHMAQTRIAELQDELIVQQQAATAMATGYQAELDRLETECREGLCAAGENIQRLEAELANRTSDLNSRIEELGKCVDLLHAAEAAVEERTKWALDLKLQLYQSQKLLTAAQHSRWIRLGKKFGLGPQLGES